VTHPARLFAGLVWLAVGLWGGMAQAEITLPAGASITFEETENPGRYEMPVGAHNGDTLPTIPAEGRVATQAWRIGGSGLSSFQVILNLREQLANDGYEILLECDEDTCGGYDFRFDTKVIGEPEMHVDLGDYQFLSAHIPGNSGEFLSLLVSRSVSAVFIQIITVSQSDAPARSVAPGTETTNTADETPPATSAPAAATGALGPAMETLGRYVLTDLRFEVGSAALGEGSYQSLADLAEYLTSRGNARVALVGHTDAQGSLSANIGISEQRATSVMNRLTESYGIASDRLEARGVGYLAPIASNQTEEGRTRNRRVEAILISTE